MLAEIRNRRIAEAVRRIDVPVVDLRGERPVQGIPVVAPDFEAVAGQAFQHLYGSGFRQFGYCGLVRGKDRRRDRKGDAFVRVAKQNGCPCHVLRVEVSRRRGNILEQIKQCIGRWVEQLPKPIGVMTADHPLGLHFLDACRRIDVAVPDEVAMLSSGNDDFVCNLSQPGQTSVDLASDKVGYEAASLLERMMRGEPKPEEPILIEPRGVVLRGSSDVVATEDREVAVAVRFIRRHACRSIKVSDVLDHVVTSRAALEPRLKRVCGRTIHQEIRRFQIKRVQQLLTDTDWPIKQIATTTGFQTTQYLTRAFRKATGTTPAQYRRSARP